MHSASPFSYRLVSTRILLVELDEKPVGKAECGLQSLSSNITRRDGHGPELLERWLSA